MLAWHQAPGSDPAGSKHKGDHQPERDCWLACADGLLGDACDTRTGLVFDQLASIVRASALVEMVHGLMRPSLQSGPGQSTQEAFTLILFYQNHRRSTRGKRQGQAPLALLTGTPLEAPWWAL